MEKRTDQRIPVSVEIRFFHGRMFYSGTLSDISKKGMFISTVECIPPDFRTVIIIPYKDDLLTVNSRVSRLRQNSGCFTGMGIEILHSKNRYLEFIDSLTAVT